jgi:hypothetical protein
MARWSLTSSSKLAAPEIEIALGRRGVHRIHFVASATLRLVVLRLRSFGLHYT